MKNLNEADKVFYDKVAYSLAQSLKAHCGEQCEEYIEDTCRNDFANHSL